MVGQTISHYKITEKLGEGGMGVVYKAEDLKLGRTVALKFLPSHLLESAEHKGRFLHEARAAASLDHPNVCTVYEIDDVEGRALLAMACLEGQTLKQKIAERPLPLQEALDIALQISQGLRAAHEKGVVHRDIKPANIMITLQGLVKIMDFGLAQLSDRTKLTASGTKLGTPAYMSPEQAQGRPVDRRSDIFSLGVVLYEMVTGRLPFVGGNEQAVLYAIISQEPEPPTAVRTGLPIELDKIILKALAKDPAERFQHAADLIVDLRSLSTTAKLVEQSGRAVRAASPVSRKRERFAWGLVACLAFALLAALYGRSVPKRAEEMRVIHLQLNPPKSARFTEFGQVVSPDGGKIVFVATAAAGKQSLWVRGLDASEARELDGTEGASYPFWSPDSRSVAFFASSKLKRVDLAGGTAQTLCDAPAGRGGAWSPDGTLAFAPTFNSGVHTVPASGGRSEPLTVFDRVRQDYSHRWPTFLPDGNKFLVFVSTTSEDSGVYVSSLKEPARIEKIITSNFYAQYALDPAGGLGRLLWVRGETLVAQRFDLSTMRLVGDAVPLADLRAIGDFGGTQFSVSNRGVLVVSGTAPLLRRLEWRDRTGKLLGTAGPAEGLYDTQISPDGRRIALSVSDSSGNFDIWVHELTRGVRARITSAAGFEGLAVWSPDGGKIAFTGARGGPVNLFLGNPAGAGEGERLTQSSNGQMAYDWSTSGNWLAFAEFHPVTAADIWVLPVDAAPEHRKPEPFLVTEFSETQPQFSPASALLAYTSNESGREEIHVRDFPASPGQRRWVISTQGGAYPRWNANGRELFYVSSDSRLMSVEVSSAGSEPAFSRPRELFRIPVRLGVVWYDYDVAPDGQRFLVQAPADDAASEALSVVLNFQAGLQP